MCGDAFTLSRLRVYSYWRNVSKYHSTCIGEDGSALIVEGLVEFNLVVNKGYIFLFGDTKREDREHIDESAGDGYVGV